MGKQCDFCGGNLGKQRSKEHYVPQWLLNHVGLDDQQSIHRDFDQHLNLKSTRINAMLNNVAGHVCKNCNGGWMHDLELVMQQILPGLISDRDSLKHLQPYVRLALARWACKVAYCWDAVSLGARTVPRAHFSELWSVQNQIPAGVMVFGARSPFSIPMDMINSPNWVIYRAIGTPEDASDGDVRASYKIALQFGHLVLIVAYWADPDMSTCFLEHFHVPIMIPRRKYFRTFLESEPTFEDSRSLLNFLVQRIDILPEDHPGGWMGDEPTFSRQIAPREAQP